MMAASYRQARFDSTAKTKSEAISNMATTPMDQVQVAGIKGPVPSVDLLLDRLMPRKFRGDEEVGDFIMRCHRFFTLARITPAAQDAWIPCLIHEDLWHRYETVPMGVGGYAERLRIAFGKKTTVIDDMSKLLNFRRTSESVEETCEMLSSLIDKVLAHGLDKEVLLRQFLVHSANDEDVRREVDMRKLSTVEEVKETMRVIERVKKGPTSVGAVRSYREAALHRTDVRPGAMTTQSTREVRKPAVRDERECWNCGQKGHISSNCQRPHRKRCYRCKTVGHIARECPEVECFKCHGKGHISTSCKVQWGSMENRYEGKKEEKRDRGSRRDDGQWRSGVNRRFVGAIGESETEGEGEIEQERGKYEGDDRRYPNGYAPPEVEAVGALH